MLITSFMYYLIVCLCVSMCLSVCIQNGAKDVIDLYICCVI